jgi:hypothetical protein
MNIVALAWQVIEMQTTIESQRHEIVRLSVIEEEYNQFLDSSLKHNQAMVGNLMGVLLTPGVAEAFCKNATTQETA